MGLSGAETSVDAAVVDEGLDDCEFLVSVEEVDFAVTLSMFG